MDEAVRQRLGVLWHGRVRAGQDAAGWVRGTIAGDVARLAAGSLPRGGRG